MSQPHPRPLQQDRQISTQARQAVWVLGSHRSGTSALAGVLTLSGCDGPATPMTAAEDNPKGFFESRKIHAVNNEILGRLGSRWDDWTAIPPGWADSADAETLKDRARKILEQEYGPSQRFVVKDPRMCRLLPFWQHRLEEMLVAPRYVLTHRNPLDVAASLERRNGLKRDFGMLIWLRHVLDAEAGTRGAMRVFTSFERLMTDWPEEIDKIDRALSLGLPPRSADLRAGVEDFLDGDLRRFTHAAKEVLSGAEVSDWVRDTYAILEGWAGNGETAADYPQLDAVRAALDAGSAAFGRVLTSRTQTEEISAAAQETAELRRDLTIMKTRLDSLQRVLTEAQNRARAADAGMRAASANALRLDAARAEDCRISAQLIVARETAERRLQEAETQIQELNDALAETRSALEQRRHEAQQSHDALRDKAQEIDTLHSAAQKWETQATEARSEADRLQEALAEAQGTVAQLRTDHAKAIADAERRVNWQREEIAGLTQAMAARQRDLEETRRDLVKSQASQDLTERDRLAQIARAERAEYIVHDIQASSSWRLTAPLRALSAVLRRKR